MIKASQIEYHDLSLQGSNLNIWAGKKKILESKITQRIFQRKSFSSDTGVITHFSLI